MEFNKDDITQLKATNKYGSIKHVRGVYNVPQEMRSIYVKTNTSISINAKKRKV